MDGAGFIEDSMEKMKNGRWKERGKGESERNKEKTS
jgi:hypothetical protein